MQGRDIIWNEFLRSRVARGASAAVLLRVQALARAHCDAPSAQRYEGLLLVERGYLPLCLLESFVMQAERLERQRVALAHERSARIWRNFERWAQSVQVADEEHLAVLSLLARQSRPPSKALLEGLLYVVRGEISLHELARSIEQAEALDRRLAARREREAQCAQAGSADKSWN